LFLLAAKGWCILNDSIPILQMAQSLISSLGFVACEAIIYYFDIGNWFYLVLFIEVIFMILIVHDLLVSIYEANLQTTTHLSAINQNDINSETTPIFQKHVMLKQF
jgi:hypothetical protein